MLNIDTRKYKIISQITNLEKAYQIQKIEEFLKRIFSDDEQGDKDLIFKPMRKDLDIDNMVNEQGFKGINRVLFDKLINEIDIKEPLEYLLDID